MMKITATIAIVSAALLLGAVGGAQAQPTDPDGIARQKQQKRAPARVIVRPPIQRNRHDSTEFPRTDNLGYPGPNAVRQCVSWLQTENRPSGTVVTPQMRCWWQRG